MKHGFVRQVFELCLSITERTRFHANFDYSAHSNHISVVVMEKEDYTKVVFSALLWLKSGKECNKLLTDLEQFLQEHEVAV